MQDYIIEPENITTDKLITIIQQFLQHDVPHQRMCNNHYIGKHKILRKMPTFEGKPCNKAVANFTKNITDTYTGYSVGIPPTYSCDEADIDNLLEVFEYNDEIEQTNKLMANALRYGVSAEIAYIDTEGKIRFTSDIDPTSIIPVFDNTLEHNLVLAIRLFSIEYSPTEKDYFVDVYDDKYINHYRSESGFLTIIPIGSEPHYFNQVPVTFFAINDDKTSIAEPIFSLEEAYETILSDALDEKDILVDSYIVLTGAIATEDDLKSMKENRIIMLDEGCTAEYLTKNLNNDETETLLMTTEQKIRELSGCPNFASEEFATSSGIAIKFRCMQLETSVAEIMNRFKKALQKRIELIYSVLSKVEGEDLFSKIEITFTRNIPANESDTATMISQLQGIVSQETLLSLLSFVKNPAEEVKAVKKEREESIDMYGFDNEVNNNEEDEER